MFFTKLASTNLHVTNGWQWLQSRLDKAGDDPEGVCLY